MRTEKPWGYEELLEINDKYLLKLLSMNQGCRCSLQYHEHKRETIYVVSGELKILIGSSQDDLVEHVVQPGGVITIEPFVVHRMEALTDSVYLEASTPENDDVVRLADDYRRA